MYTIKNNNNSLYFDNKGNYTKSYNNLLMFTYKKHAKRYLTEKLNDKKEFEIVPIR